MPSPEDLAGPRAAASQHVHTFRLHNAEHEALLGLADRAGLGTSALSRRIVEAYLKAHAPITQTPRNNRTRKR